MKYRSCFVQSNQFDTGKGLRLNVKVLIAIEGENVKSFCFPRSPAASSGFNSVPEVVQTCIKSADKLRYRYRANLLVAPTTHFHCTILAFIIVGNIMCLLCIFHPVTLRLGQTYPRKFEDLLFLHDFTQAVQRIRTHYENPYRFSTRFVRFFFMLPSHYNYYYYYY